MQLNIKKVHYNCVSRLKTLFTVCCSFMGQSDWMRIGAFFFDSQVALLSERLSLPLKIINKDNVEKALESSGACLLSNIKKGIWIAGNFNSVLSPYQCSFSTLFCQERYNKFWMTSQLTLHDKIADVSRSPACSMPCL